MTKEDKMQENKKSHDLSRNASHDESEKKRSGFSFSFSEQLPETLDLEGYEALDYKEIGS